MSFSEGEFLRNLESGYIDRKRDSSQAFLPALLTNNPADSRRVLTSLERQLNHCRSFHFSVAFITTSGVASLINVLDTLRARNVRGRILASQYQNFTEPEALKRLLQFPNIDLRISVDHNLHTKGYFFEHDNECWSLIIGSSNLTANALSKNAEWNLQVSALKDSTLLEQSLREFEFEFDRGISADANFIQAYEFTYQVAKEQRAKKRKYVAGWLHPDTNLIDSETKRVTPVVRPNRMQEQALANLADIRGNYLDRALLVSATGTGKTFLSAFDAKAIDAHRLLFVVHRRNIAEAALRSFRTVFGRSRTFGLYSGESKKVDRDFVFCTVQSISKAENLSRFSRKAFDYIVIDETHRAGAASYQRVIDYFEPKFLLGMTATPERTDGYDIFSLFNHTIAYEIRLHQALEEDMLSPFHYYGVTDLLVNGQVVDDNTDFNLLSSEERVTRILEKAAFYGTDTGEIRGLVFCSRKDECIELASKFRNRGVKAVALTGDDSEEKRVDAIQRLESTDPGLKIDYIFTVDIFNEGVDIPKVNQVIMLRPTQSAIVFVQQMGRGLRKTEGKEYLTIIDFIGNYANNFLVPIALYGDNTYNKDRLRKMLNGGSSSIPGTSTVNFDLISKKQIYEAIDSAKMDRMADLRTDYDLLRFQLGRPPMMMDFLEHGSRDPFLFVGAKKSFFNFAELQEDQLQGVMSEHEKLVLEKFSIEVNNGKRVEESLLLKHLIDKGSVNWSDFQEILRDKYGVESAATLESISRGLNLLFVRGNQDGNMIPVGEMLGFSAVEQNGFQLSKHPDLETCLSDPNFKKYLMDSVNYSIESFDRSFESARFRGGFQLYKKYSRKDVFRILNWQTNPVAQNVGGYKISEDGSNCPVFVTYHKSEGIAMTTDYEDYFINQSTFAWMSKSKRTLNSPDVQAIRAAPESAMRIPLFIKKSDDEGADFYFVGDVQAIEDSFEETTMQNEDGRSVPVVKVEFILDDPVDDSLYYYFTDDDRD